MCCARLGASARAMLVAAAAKEWNVPAGRNHHRELDGAMHKASGKSLTYGALSAEKAAKMPRYQTPRSP